MGGLYKWWFWAQSQRTDLTLAAWAAFSRGVRVGVCSHSSQKSGKDETPGGTPWGPWAATSALLPYLPEHSQTWGSSQTYLHFPFSQLAKSEGYGVRLPGWEFSLHYLHAVGPRTSALSSVKWDDNSIYLLRIIMRIKWLNICKVPSHTHAWNISDAQ